jgi:hypothetical protein
VSQDPNYRIYPGAIEEWFWLGREVSSSNVDAVHARPVPQVSRIAVDDAAGTITINASGFDSIRWYADGAEIARGATLNLNAHAAAINSYVRATVVSNSNGVLYVQPFGIQQGTPRALPTLTSIGNATLPEIVLPRDGGAPARTQMGLRLPGGVRITTSAGARPAAIMWQDLNEIAYNPLSPRCQTFTVRGDVFVDPNRLANPADTATAVSVQIRVPCLPDGCLCSLCGDCGTCRFCDPCLRCFGECRRECSHRNCSRTFHCGTCGFCTRSPVRHDYRWDGVGESTAVGNFSYIRAFPIDLNGRFDDISRVETDLLFRFSPGSPSGRRLLVWTDLTGEADTAMVTQSNINAGRVARSDSGISQGDTSAAISIPRSMLYDSGTGRLATVIYVVATTNSTNFHEQPTEAVSSGIFRTDLTDVISRMELSVTGLPVWEEDLSSIFEIMGVSATGFLIRNATDEPLLLRGTYLSNTANPRLWRLPAMTIPAGETVSVSQKHGEIFPILPGQQIRLTDMSGSLLSTFAA